MKPVAIQFRVKRDIRPSPPIPVELITGMNELFATKINNTRGLSMSQRLGAVYAFTDRFNSFVATFTVCQKGAIICSYRITSSFS